MRLVQNFIRTTYVHKEMLSYANKKGLLAVPAAMTPSEVDRMFKEGADIVKVFPAAVVTPRFQGYSSTFR